jgi:hypothetical protein
VESFASRSRIDSAILMSMIDKDSAWTNLTWLERIYPGIAQDKVRKNMRRKKYWSERLNDSGITHKEKLPGGAATYTRHCYVPMSGDVVNESVRDTSLCAYMSTLQEVKQWDNSLPASILFVGRREETKTKD